LNGADADIDSARGGSAIAAAVRSARVLNVMSSNLAKSFGISESQRRFHVRVDDAKANLAPATAATWFRLFSVSLGNGTPDRPGDEVAAAGAWKPPDLLAGLPVDAIDRVRDAISGKGLRENIQAEDWIGHAIGAALDLDSKTEPDRTKIKSALKFWLSTGALVRRTERVDGKGSSDDRRRGNVRMTRRTFNLQGAEVLRQVRRPQAQTGPAPHPYRGGGRCGAAACRFDSLTCQVRCEVRLLGRRL
jgi:hypothetical protein